MRKIDCNVKNGIFEDKLKTLTSLAKKAIFWCLSKNRSTAFRKITPKSLLRIEQSRTPGENSYMKRSGMLIGKRELKPDSRPLWVWFELYLTSTRCHLKQTWVDYQPLFRAGLFESRLTLTLD